MHTRTDIEKDTRASLRILPDGKSLAPADDNDIWVNVGYAGKVPHEEWFHLMNHALKPGGVIVDCGAFIGDHTQQFVSQGFETIAIEPFFDSFVCLCYNSPLSRNIFGAAGDGSRYVRDFLAPGTNHGMRQVRKDPNGCESIRVDDLGLKRLDFLKIDVEGWEPDVLVGAAESIRKFRPVMYVETNKEALQANGHTMEGLESQLRGLGYRLDMDGLPPRWDWICWPD